MFETPSLRLPAGMRDFAPRAAAARRRIAETLLGVFERWGFSRVITPAFEYEDALALGLGAAGRDRALRFVEPSTGRVVALRPDITPQIARLVATRFQGERGPIRLCYEGTVLRLERGARSQRELIQAGVELTGVTSPQGDAEVIALGAEALAAVGLPPPTIDLGHLGVMREVLDALALPPEALAQAHVAIAKRDRAGLDEALRASGASQAVIAFARLLPELSGEPAVLDEAARRAPSGRIRRGIGDLRAIVEAVTRRFPPDSPARLHVDLAEVRGFDYYTGVRFQGFVPGAPAPVLQGGRYDDLLGRYGSPSPAVGFAVDVESAAAALEGAPGAGAPESGAVLVVGSAEAAARVAAAIRRQGRAAAALLVPMADADIADYAARWGFREIMAAGGSGAGDAAGGRVAAPVRVRGKRKER
jgi:ATP phosphoribosyltransferase regulatory subunit